MKKKNFIISSIVTIALCFSMIVGSTFALFSSESEVNIAVSSGKVSVVATIDQNSVKTKQLYETTYTQGANNMFAGVASFTEEGLTLEKFVPGDGIKFNIVVKNNSNIAVKYRTTIVCAEDNGLFDGLVVNIANKEHFNGIKYVTNWASLDVGSAEEIVPVSIELPATAGNEYQNVSCVISYMVEAVQGNGYTGPDAIITRFAEGDLPTTQPVEDFFGLQFPKGPDSVTLEAAWKFAATETVEEVQDSPYKDWICDFMITCDDDIELGELGLWGKYDGYNVSFTNPLELSSEQSLFMLTSTLTALTGQAFTYEAICDVVKVFDCGVFRGLQGDKMQGKTITVSLCLIDTNYALNLLDQIGMALGTTDQSIIIKEAMKLEYWTMGENLLIANQTSYTFN